MSYTRDSENDLIYNSSTGEYVSATINDSNPVTYYAWFQWYDDAISRRVFTTTETPQVGDTAWYFGYNATRTQYNIDEADLVVTLSDVETTDRPYIQNGEMYFKINLQLPATKATRHPEWDILPPIQILVDLQGRVLIVDGKALKPYTPTPNVTYYAWYNIKGDIDFSDGLCFTLNETPSVGDTLYCKSGSDIVVSPYTVYAYNSTYNTIDCYAGSFSYSRKSSEDVVIGDELINPVALTDSSSNAFTYNGNAVLVEQISTVTLSFVKDSTITSYTIDGTTYTSNQSITLAEGNHTLSISSPSSVYEGGLLINDYGMGLTISCTFTISGTTVTFTSSTTTYSGTTSTIFSLSYDSSGSIN